MTTHHFRTPPPAHSKRSLINLEEAKSSKRGIDFNKKASYELPQMNMEGDSSPHFYHEFDGPQTSATRKENELFGGTG